MRKSSWACQAVDEGIVGVLVVECKAPDVKALNRQDFLAKQTVRTLNAIRSVHIAIPSMSGFSN